MAGRDPIGLPAAVVQASSASLIRPGNFLEVLLCRHFIFRMKRMRLQSGQFECTRPSADGSFGDCDHDRRTTSSRKSTQRRRTMLSVSGLGPLIVSSCNSAICGVVSEAGVRRSGGTGDQTPLRCCSDGPGLAKSADPSQIVWSPYAVIAPPGSAPERNDASPARRRCALRPDHQIPPLYVPV
jgi:hypothetical protein